MGSENGNDTLQKTWTAWLKPIVFKLVVVFIFYTFSRIAFYWLNQKSFSSLSSGDFFLLLKGGLVFDASAIAYTNALFVLLWFIPFKSLFHTTAYQKFVDYTFILVNIICLFLNSIDFYYYEFNLKRITADFSFWAGEKNTFQVMGTFMIDNSFSVVFVLGALWLFSYFIRKIKWPTLSWSNMRFVLFQCMGVLIAIPLIIGAMRGGFKHSTRPITLSNAGQYVSRSEYMPIVLNTPFSIIRTIDKKVFEDPSYISLDEAQTIYNTTNTFNYPTDSFNKKNVVILLLESFSREHSAYLNPDLYPGTKDGYTPFLDSLMRQSLVCTNAYANGRKSIDAMPSVLASIPSLEVPYVLSHYSLNHINSIASLLKPLGYTSAFFHGAPNGSMGFQAFTQIAGFDKYIGKNEFNNDEHYDGIWGIWDEEFFQFFGKELNTMQQPFVATCFSLSSHHPFKVPERYSNSFKAGKLEVHRGVQYTDLALQKFFEFASRQEWYPHTLFVVLADHSTVAWSEKYNSQAGAFAIPIIYFDPGNPLLKGKFESVTQQIDILPSILDYLHFNKPFVAFGKSIFDTLAPRVALNYLNDHYQLFTNDQLLTLSNGNSLTDVYDITKTWALSKNIIGQNEYKDTRTLKLHQSLIKQYNYRLIHNKLIIENE